MIISYRDCLQNRSIFDAWSIENCHEDSDWFDPKSYFDVFLELKFMIRFVSKPIKILDATFNQWNNRLNKL